MNKTSVLYSSAGFIRFALVIYITFRTVSLLSIEEYAYFGIANVLSMLFGLIWFFNIDSSFQKLFSKRRLNRSVNLLLLLSTLFLSVSVIFLTTFILMYAKNIDHTFQVYMVMETSYLIHYCLLISLNSYILSILNAKQKKIEYFLQITLPAMLVAVYLLSIDKIVLSTLFLVHSLSIGSSILLIGFLNPSILRKSSYSSRRIKHIFMYMIGYTYRSLPTLSSKYFLDLVIRTTILEKFGDLELAAYNFCQNLLNIFRSFEQSIARAITPFILRQSKANLHALDFARNVIAAQTIITMITLITSFMWMPILIKIIKNKPVELFDIEMLLILGCILISGYWKNYSLMYMKKFSSAMKVFYTQTTCVNLILMLIFSILTWHIKILLIIQFSISILHSFILMRVVRRYRN